MERALRRHRGVVHRLSESIDDYFARRALLKTSAPKGADLWAERSPSTAGRRASLSFSVTRSDRKGCWLRSRLHVGRQHNRTDATSSRSGDTWKGRVRTGHFIAAGASVRAAGCAVVRLIEGEDEHAVLLIRRRVQDDRNPGLQPLAYRDEAAGFAVRTRRIMTVVAKVGNDINLLDNAVPPIVHKQTSVQALLSWRT